MELNGGSRGARLARLKIWQISCVAGALSATSLAAVHQVAVSGLSFATPNARVADAFSAIPLNMTAVLADLRAELPEVETNSIQEHRPTRLLRKNSAPPRRLRHPPM